MFYAINGVGMGHLTRQYAMATNVQRLLKALNLRADIRFITTSEAPQLTQRFPTYKLPSRQLFQANEVTSYTAECRFLISNLAAGFRPDILVMDTIPEGTFQEFPYLRDFARRSVFINRHRQQQDQWFLSWLANYHLVLVPDHAQRQAEYSLPENFGGYRRFVGPVTLWEWGISQQSLRKTFGWSEQRPLAYVSAGGGGDQEAQAQMQFLVSSLVARGYYVLAGYGPLYQGPKLYHPRVVPLSETQISHYFSGVDLAISAAGYNTYQELLAAGTPSLFYAQAKKLDRQDLRVAAGVQQGWHLELPEFSEPALDEALKQLQAQSAQLRQNLQARPKAKGGLLGAYEILKLHCSLPDSPLDEGQLALAAAHLLNWPLNPDAFMAYYRWQRICWRDGASAEQQRLSLEEARICLEGASKIPTLIELSYRYKDLLQLLVRFCQSYARTPQLERGLEHLLSTSLHHPQQLGPFIQCLRHWLEHPAPAGWIQAWLNQEPLQSLPARTWQYLQGAEQKPLSADLSLQEALESWHKILNASDPISDRLS